MDNQKRKLFSWQTIERFKTVTELIATLIVLAPVLVAVWGLVQQGVNAVAPAWLLVLTSAFSVLLGYVIGQRYKQPVDERVIYDGRRGIRSSDFKEVPAKAAPNGKMAQGKMEIKDGVLILQRTNIEGRYELHLREYHFRGESKDYLPQNEVAGSIRKLKVICKARVTKGKHIVEFVMRRHPKDERLDTYIVPLDDEWKELDFDLRVSPTDDCLLKIYDRDVSESGSSLQLKKLALVEPSD